MQSNKLTSGSFFLLFAACLLSFSACKKNQTIDEIDLKTSKQKIEAIKAWYVKDSQGSLNIASNTGKKIKLSLRPNWENAVYKEIDSKSVMVTVIASSIGKIAGETKRYLLIVVDDEGVFKSKIVSMDMSKINKLITPEDVYRTAFTNEDISPKNDLSTTFQVYGKDMKFEKMVRYEKLEKKSSIVPPSPPLSPKVGSGGKIAATVIVTTCTDWYVVYPDNTSEYLGRTCEDQFYEDTAVDYIAKDDALGSDSQLCTDANKEVLVDIVSTDSGSSSTMITPTSKEKEFTWTFLKHSFGMFHYISKEKGVLKKVGNDWQWDTLTNEQYGLNGQALAVLSLTAVKHVPTIGIYNAGMSISFSFSASIVCKGFPLSNNLTTTVNSPVWNVNLF